MTPEQRKKFENLQKIFMVAHNYRLYESSCNNDIYCKNIDQDREIDVDKVFEVIGALKEFYSVMKVVINMENNEVFIYLDNFKL